MTNWFCLPEMESHLERCPHDFRGFLKLLSLRFIITSSQELFIICMGKEKQGSSFDGIGNSVTHLGDIAVILPISF